jgi:type II secretory pathway pseudopilin PulG
MQQAKLRRSRAGFTLIELIVVIGTVPVMIGLLLPAVQKVRESTNRSTAQNNIRQMALACHNYHSQNRTFPPTLAEAMRTAKLPETGEVDGYKAVYRGDRNSFSLTLEPVPGVTGFETVIAEGTPGGQTRFASVATPGAEEGRARMFAAVRAAGASAIAQLAHLLPPNERTMLEGQVMPYLSSAGNVSQLVARWTGGAGNEATFGRIMAELDGQGGGAFGDGSVRFISAGLGAQLHRSLQLGAYGEKWQELSGVVPPSHVAGATSLFSASSLGILTQQATFNDAVAAELRALLARADAAAKIGDIRGAQSAMDEYLRKVAAVTPAIKPSSQLTAIGNLDARGLIVMGRIYYPR